MKRAVEVFEFGGDGERVDLIDGVLHVGYHRLDGGKKIEGISSVQIWTEEGYPIGIIRRNGALYHVTRLEVRPEGYAVATVRTRR